MTARPSAHDRSVRRLWASPSPLLRHALAAVPVLLIALALYVRTLLPDVGTWDTAEFQTIGPVLGIAHPTGYPTYTLLAWVASVVLQPFGNEAYRADLLSALLVAGAAALLAIRAVQATQRWQLGLLAGLAFAVTPVAWGLATRADAHALHGFLAALLLVILAGWASRQERGARSAGRWLVAAAVVFGLSLGNHALTSLLAPGIAAYVLLAAPRILWRQWRLVIACVAALALTTVVVYAYLPLRSMMDPPLDYADPETWEAFWYVVLGQQFQGSFGALPDLPRLLSDVWGELVRNLGLLALLVPVGIVLGGLRHARLTAITVLWFGASWVFALGYPNAAIERYHLVPLLAAILWLALGIDALWDAARGLLVRPSSADRGLRQGIGEQGVGVPWAGRGRRVDVALGTAGLLLVALALGPVPDRLPRLDASGETHGREWLEATLAALEPDAVVMSWWSYSTPLWYGRWVEGRRPDVRIVDDRDVLDEGFGRVENAIDHYLGTRPVYLIRLPRDLPALAERYALERVPGIPPPGEVYRVLGAAPGNEATLGRRMVS